MCPLVRLSLGILFVGALFAQERLTNEQAAQVEKVFSHLKQGQQRHDAELTCHINRVGPFLDFSFHFEAGYILACPVNLFEGRKALLRSYLKITPAIGDPVMLGITYAIPALPPELRDRVRMNKIHSNVEGSGGFLLGEGSYTFEVFLIDGAGRFQQTSWKLKADRSHAERHVRLAIPPYSIAPLSDQWQSLKEKQQGDFRVTLYVNASPMNPFQQKLRAWDRAFLLGCISSVVQTFPSASVKLVAFNLEQQKELYRTNRFQPQDLSGLSTQMMSMELGVVSARTLSEQDGGLRLLPSLLREEEGKESDKQPRAIIFLGPWTRVDRQFPKAFAGAAHAAVHDIVYFFPAMRGQEPPDSMQHFTASVDGTVHRIHSPGELAQVLHKISDQIRENEEKP